MSKLIKEIAIEENCFTYNEVTYEKLFNHPHDLKYRFFTENDYDYVEDEELIKKLDILTKQMLKLIKVEILFDTEYQEYVDQEGNVIILEDGVVKMINDHVLDSHGNMI